MRLSRGILQLIYLYLNSTAYSDSAERENRSRIGLGPLIVLQNIPVALIVPAEA
jgi:hypothetical protein